MISERMRKRIEMKLNGRKFVTAEEHEARKKRVLGHDFLDKGEQRDSPSGPGEDPPLMSKRFLPLFLTQFMGALNDNFFKNAILIFIMFGMAVPQDTNLSMLMPLGALCFILPFFLFAAPAGQLAEKYSKAKVIQRLKASEVLIMTAGIVALISESISAMMITLFLMGSQSAFFGPLKYAILPELVGKKSLMAANAWVEAGTFFSILIGTLLGGLLIGLENGVALVACGLLAFSVLGLIASLKIPDTQVYNRSINVDFGFKASYRLIKTLREQKQMLAVIGVSWFWFVGATLLTQFPSFSKEMVGSDEALVTLFLCLFSVGIGIGSWLANYLLKGSVSAVLAPLSAVVMAIFAIDLYFATLHFKMANAPISMFEFTNSFAGIRVCIDMTLLALAGGVFIVPLYTLIQAGSEEGVRARVFAANNLMNAFAMVISAVLCMLVLKIGGVHDVFLLVAVSSVIAAVLVCGLLPRHLFRSVAIMVFKSLFKVEVVGAENFKKAGDRAVIVANHVSWLDGPLLAAFGPENAIFPINTHVFQKWWGGLSKLFARMVPIDPTNPYSTKTLIKRVSEGDKLIIFPEGRLTTTGSLMKIYDGPGLIADKADAVIVPVRLDGVQFCKLSRLQGRMPLRWFPKITVTVLEPVKLGVDPNIKGRARREAASAALYDLMSKMMFDTSDQPDQTLFTALKAAEKTFGSNHPMLEDPQIMARPLPYKTITVGARVLGKKFAKITQQGEAVGVLLPNAAGSVVTFFALQAHGRVPAMLNFSAGPAAVASACQTACVKTVLTSRRFIEMGKLESTEAALREHVNIVYLEDLKDSVSLIDKLEAKVKDWVNPRPDKAILPDQPAVILFTSGSEGSPKGVVLSHRNLLSNMSQLASRISFNTQDVVFNSLPIFHSFGLTGAMLLPIMNGIKVFMYPSPLHYKIVPELVYDTNATILFGTDTFLSNYAKKANPYDFYSIRYIFAGAEKVKPETRQLFMDRFMKGIFEGYGATETAPVIAANTPMHFRNGTVGRLMPGIEYKLEDIPGIDRGGRLWVKGPNVMLGYYKSDKPGEIQAPEGGWYDTGDIVDVDADGYVEILGRAKRFAKIAGEMVSLTLIEQLIKQFKPDDDHAVVAIPDPKKGEQLVLFTTDEALDRPTLSAFIKEKGQSELSVPRTLRAIKTLPVLGTGKTDYVTLNELAVTV